MTNQKCCPECGKPTLGYQDGELCDECAENKGSKMTEERKGEIRTFGAKCKTFAKAASEARQTQQKPRELTIDEKIQNVATNASNALNEQGNALNAIAYYIENTDAKVAKAGGLMQWVQKDIQKKERLAERKREYAKNKKSS